MADRDDELRQEIEEALASGRRRQWEPAGGEDQWTASDDRQDKRAFVSVVEGAYEARVYRHPTGPTGPDPQLAHGPQVFDDVEEALEYCEDALGEG